MEKLSAWQKKEILKDKFPEVKQAVTRIGSAEMPADAYPEHW